MVNTVNELLNLVYVALIEYDDCGPLTDVVTKYRPLSNVLEKSEVVALKTASCPLRKSSVRVAVAVPYMLNVFSLTRATVTP